jgi:hypothetical protein
LYPGGRPRCAPIGPLPPRASRSHCAVESSESREQCNTKSVWNSHNAKGISCQRQKDATAASNSKRFYFTLGLTLVKILNVSTKSYTKAFDDAMSELRRLLDARAQINERISQLRDTVCALAHSLEQDSRRREQLMHTLDELSAFTPRLTDAVKDALYSAFDSKGHRKLPAIQVKELMEVRRFDFSNFPNPLASVHSTLRRLVDQGSIGSAVQMGSAVYYWKGPHYGARRSLANMLATDAEQRKQMAHKIQSRIDQHLSRSGIRRVGATKG